MIVSNGDMNREWSITLHNGDDELVVDHLFDAYGNETFDATEAVEADCDGELHAIEAGDVIIFELVAD